MKAILNLGTVVWQQSNIVQQGVFCFQTSFGYKENFMQCREKSIFCMQYVCNVHCNYVVAHAYNTIAKIQSSSGWALLYVLRSLRLAQDFGNILASSCCTGNFSGMTTISSKWYTLQKKGMCIIISFFYFYAIFWLVVKNAYNPNLGKCTLLSCLNQSNIVKTFGLASSSKEDLGMSITLFLFIPLDIFS